MPLIFITATLLAFAIVLGGGGSPAHATEAALQIVFAVALGVLALWPPKSPITPPRMAWLLAGLVMFLPLFQLIPLWPELWQSLPGRATMREALDLVGSADQWQPFTLTPSRTLAAVLAMVAPVALFLLATRLKTAERQQLLLVVIGGALITSVLGGLQVAAGESGAWRLYAETHLLYVTGFFANRNAAADLLLIGLLALAAWWASADRSPFTPLARLLLLAIALLLILALLMTGSRSGIALLLPVLLLVLLMVWPGNANMRRPPAIAGLGVLVVAGGFFLAQLPALQPVVGRFLRDGDQR
jgi:hypothetical protein